MRIVVLDTNVLLRLVHADAPDHGLCQSAVRHLTERGSTLAIPVQVAVEFWVVAPGRPTSTVSAGRRAWRARSSIRS
jgi:predicted nucleic acid-binding protein